MNPERTQHLVGLILIALAWGGAMGFAGLMIGLSWGTWAGRRLARREARELQRHSEEFGYAADETGYAAGNFAACRTMRVISLLPTGVLKSGNASHLRRRL
jgi:uncharacterized membrane protein YdjX (TVP38/TMEM64 family)